MTTYWNGYKARYTGKSQTLYGGLFYELEILDGNRKGDFVWTPRRGRPEGRI